MQMLMLKLDFSQTLSAHVLNHLDQHTRTEVYIIKRFTDNGKPKSS